MVMAGSASLDARASRPARPVNCLKRLLVFRQTAGSKDALQL